MAGGPTQNLKKIKRLFSFKEIKMAKHINIDKAGKVIFITLPTILLWLGKLLVRVIR